MQYSRRYAANCRVSVVMRDNISNLGHSVMWRAIMSDVGRCYQNKCVDMFGNVGVFRIGERSS